VNHGARHPGLVLDSSVLVAAERARLATPGVIKNIRTSVGDVPLVICALTMAELAHGIYRTNSPERSQHRRQFLDELKAQVPVHPVTEATAEIIARIGGEQAAKGTIFRWAISSSEHAPWNSVTGSERAMSATLNGSPTWQSCNSER
jgi:predicted nucleic acid-binding protein